MPSLEILNSQLADLKGPALVSFKRNHESLDKIYNKIPTRKPDGAYIERTLATGASTRGRMIVQGDESLILSRRKIIKKIRVDPFRWVTAPIIPKKDAKENIRKDKAVDLLETYVMSNISGYYEDLAQFILCGALANAQAAAASEYQGVLCWEGNYTSGVATGVTNGLFEYAVVGSQGNVRQNLTADSGIFYVSQYRHISNWNMHGRRLFGAGWRDAARHGGKLGPNKGPNVILTDPTTFTNYDDEKSQHVRIDVHDSREKPSSDKKSSMLSLAMGDSEVCCDHDIDVSLLTGNASSGLTYMINTDGWEKYVWEEFDIPPLKESMEGQDGFITKGAHHFQMICRNLAGQVAITGGNS